MTVHKPSTPTSAELAIVIERVGCGDHAAFTELYHATDDRVFGTALAVLRNRSHAEDVTQEAYLNIWRNAKRYDPKRGNAMSWVIMIVHGAAVNRVRSTKRRVDREMRDFHLALPEDSGTDPTSEGAIARVDVERVRVALRQLSAIQRDAIELAFFAGYTHVEVAEILNIPLGTVKARIRDGLLKLRKLMDADLSSTVASAAQLRPLRDVRDGQRQKAS